MKDLDFVIKFANYNNGRCKEVGVKVNTGVEFRHFLYVLTDHVNRDGYIFTMDLILVPVDYADTNEENYDILLEDKWNINDIPFGYDGLRIHINIDDFALTQPDDIIHITGDEEIVIPAHFIDGEFINYNYAFDFTRKDDLYEMSRNAVTNVLYYSIVNDMDIKLGYDMITETIIGGDQETTTKRKLVSNMIRNAMIKIIDMEEVGLRVPKTLDGDQNHGYLITMKKLNSFEEFDKLSERKA